MNLLHALGLVLLAPTVAGIAYTAAAALLMRRLGRTPAVTPLDAPALSVMKPLRGAEPGLYEALASFLAQDYPGPVQLVLGVQDPADPAMAVVEALRRAHPDADVAAVVDGRPHGANGKMANLINMLPSARHDVLVFSDADIRVPRQYLSQVAAALERPAVGAVTCYYRGEARAGVWSRLGAMGVSYGFLPVVAFGVAIGMATPCMGSTIALSRQTLERVGGLERFADELIDDYEIGRAVRALGLQVALPPLVVDHGSAERNLRELFAHELRWAATVRAIDPAGHAGSIVTQPVPLALIALVLLGGPVYAWVAAAAALAARAWLKTAVDRLAGASSGPAALLPIRDLLSFVVFLASLFVRTVYWRGVRFRVSSARKSHQPGS
jgi:ceramide glucosyltransferase